MIASATVSANSAPQAVLTGATVMEGLARAARQVAFYGPEHPLGRQALAQVCEELTVGATPHTIEAHDRELRWNGEVVHGRGNTVAQFLTAMRARFIAHISLRPPVHPAHLGQLLTTLSTDPQEMLLAGGASAGLAPLKCNCVYLKEYDLSDESSIPSTAWQTLAEGFSTSEGALLKDLIRSCEGGESSSGAQEVTHSVEEVLPLELEEIRATASEEVVAAGLAQLIQGTGERTYYTAPTQWAQWRENTARTLSAVSPYWRTLIFRAPNQPSLEYPDMLGLVAAVMSIDDCVSVVLEDPESLRAERSEGLKLALQRILADRDRRAQLQAELRVQAAARQIPDVTYQNMVELLISRIFGATTEDAAPPLRANSPTRQQLTEPLDITDLLTTINPETVRRSRLHMLSEAVDTVAAINRYGAAIYMLAAAVEECAQRQEVEGLLMALSALEHETTKPTRESAWRAIATSALTRVSAEPVVASLARALPWAGETQTHIITSLLGALGETGMRELVRVAIEGDSYRAELAVTSLLVRDGPDCPHLRDVLARATGRARNRMLEALVDAAGRETGSQLCQAVSEAGEQAQVWLLQTIVARRRTELAGAVLPWLTEGPGPACLAAVEAVAALGIREAVPSLCELLRTLPNRGESLRIQEAATAALGTLQATTAVSVLSEALSGKSALTKLVTTRLRISAAHALALIGGIEARRALEHGRLSLHPAVRKACTQGLEQLAPSHTEQIHAKA